MEKQLRVFISATWEDLQAERDAVKKTLQRQKIEVESMDNWGSKDISPREASLEKLNACNLYVGIIGFMHGEITEQEYDFAIKKNIHCFIYLKNETHLCHPNMLNKIQ